MASNDVVVPQGNPAAPAPDSGQPVSPEPESPTVDASADAPSSAPSAAMPETPAPQPSTTTVAELAPPPPAAETPPPPVAQAPAMATVSPSDAALGFKPSSAPPLDASIGQFVPPPIIARYDQTARAAGIAAPSNSAAAPAATRHRSAAKASDAVGGPETMSGAVVANLDTLQSASAPSQISVYSDAQGLPPTAVVYFPGDGTLLNGEGRLQIRAAVQAFKQNGGQGYIRVVGHSSSRTTNMPLERHLEVIFNKSQDRANAVAKEIIDEGVPANRVLVEAVGDSQPVYYESMPKGEDGNRRAEIFLQS
jgi:outer membrane protein OmpA-like peptidoglycan-associated protein